MRDAMCEVESALVEPGARHRHNLPKNYTQSIYEEHANTVGVSKNKGQGAQ